MLKQSWKVNELLASSRVKQEKREQQPFHTRTTVFSSLLNFSSSFSDSCARVPHSSSSFACRERENQPRCYFRALLDVDRPNVSRHGTKKKNLYIFLFSTLESNNGEEERSCVVQEERIGERLRECMELRWKETTTNGGNRPESTEKFIRRHSFTLFRNMLFRLRKHISLALSTKKRCWKWK